MIYFRYASISSYIIGSCILLALGTYSSGIITPVGNICLFGREVIFILLLFGHKKYSNTLTIDLCFSRFWYWSTVKVYQCTNISFQTGVLVRLINASYFQSFDIRIVNCIAINCQNYLLSIRHLIMVLGSDYLIQT